MPLTLPPIPGEVCDAFFSGLDVFLSRYPPLREEIRKNPDRITGIPIYRIDPAILVSGGRTGAAVPVAWRILAEGSAEGIAADVAQVPGQQRFAITSAAVSPNVPPLMNFLKQVVAGFQQNQAEFELRLLRMKAAYLELAWLKSNSPPEPDRFIPTVSGIKAVQRRETYTADQIFERAGVIAEKTTAFKVP